MNADCVEAVCFNSDDWNNDVPKEVQENMQDFLNKGVPDRFKKLAEFLNSPACIKNGEIDRIRVADALFRTFALQDDPTGDKSMDYKQTMSFGAEVYTEAVGTFIVHMKWDPTKPFSNYALKSIKDNAIKITKSKKMDDLSRGSLKESNLKEIAKIRKEELRDINKLSQDEQQQRIETFNQSNYPSFVDNYFNSEEGEEIDKQLFTTADERFQDNNSALVELLKVELLKFMVEFRSPRKNNYDHIMFPMWYGERITLWIQGEHSLTDEDDNILGVADKQYLAFFLKKPCSTAKEVQCAAYLLKSEVISNSNTQQPLKPHKETGWLPAIVPRCYLQSKKDLLRSEAAITHSRQRFMDGLQTIRDSLNHSDQKLV